MAESEGVFLNSIAVRLQARAPELVTRQLAALRDFPGYQRVPDDDLQRSCLRNVARVVAMLERHHHLPADIVEDELASGRRRALQGVPSEEVVRAYQAVMRVLRDAFIEEAAAAGAEAGAVLAGTTALWDLTDRNSGVLVTARQQVEIEAARRDERHRIVFLQRLVAGIDSTELTELGATHGVKADRRYWICRGRQLGTGVAPLILHLESQGSNEGARPLVAPLDDDVASISARRPTALDGATLAVTGPVHPVDIPRAFAQATRILDLARRYGRHGVVDSSSFAVRMVVEQHRELGAQLYSRHLAPLIEPVSPMGTELVRTLETYLLRGRSIGATARELAVHENTVRYRIDRYQRLAEADLNNTDDLVELWWALEYARLTRPADGEDAGDAT